MWLKAGLTAGFLALALPACAEPSQVDTETSPKATLMAMHAAFNAHDVNALRRLWHDDVKGFTVDGDKVSVMAETADGLATDMTGYFQALPDVKTRFDGIAVNGKYLTFVETVSWTGKDGDKRAQSSSAVYEIENARIRRFWYFPAQ